MNAQSKATAPSPEIDSVPRKLLIGGQWVDGADGKTFAVENPADGSVIGHVAQAGPSDVDRAVEAARAAWDEWSRMVPVQRQRLLLKIADLVDQRAEELARLETLQNGMPLDVARFMCGPGTSGTFRYYAGWCDKLQGMTTPTSIPDVHAFTLREPLGVCALVVPWNAPLMLASWKLGPCLATGNVAILKPAEETPFTALLLGEIMQEAGLPDGVVNILNGPGEITGAALSAHSGVDKISFTGSVETGKHIVAASIGNLKKVTLELGGKAPNIIFPDADLAGAVHTAANAIFFNSGQVCVAGSRLFAHRSIFDDVLGKLTEAADKIVIGSGFEPTSQMGPVVSSAQYIRVTSAISTALANGAALAAGGDSGLTDGYFIRPTILAEVSPEMSAVRDEIFGPVLVAQRFDDIDDVVRQANTTDYGLSASVWTRDFSRAHRVAKALKAGTVWINSWGVLDPHMPTGGYKQSGWGREFGSEGIDAYTQTKSVIAQL